MLNRKWPAMNFVSPIRKFPTSAVNTIHWWVNARTKKNLAGSFLLPKRHYNLLAFYGTPIVDNDYKVFVILYLSS